MNEAGDNDGDDITADGGDGGAGGDDYNAGKSEVEANN